MGGGGGSTRAIFGITGAIGFGRGLGSTRGGGGAGFSASIGGGGGGSTTFGFGGSTGSGFGLGGSIRASSMTGIGGSSMKGCSSVAISTTSTGETSE